MVYEHLKSPGTPVDPLDEAAMTNVGDSIQSLYNEYHRQYEYLEKLKLSLFTTIHMARNRFTDQTVVTKCVSKAWLDFTPPQCKDLVLRSGVLQRIPLEIVLMEELRKMGTQSRDLLTGCLDLFETESSYLLVMEYHSTTNLQDLLDAMSRKDIYLEEPLVAHIFRQLVMSVEQLHSLGYIHQDIRPANEDFKLKLIDFGTLFPSSP